MSVDWVATGAFEVSWNCVGESLGGIGRLPDLESLQAVRRLAHKGNDDRQIWVHRTAGLAS